MTNFDLDFWAICIMLQEHFCKKNPLCNELLSLVKGGRLPFLNNGIFGWNAFDLQKKMFLCFKAPVWELVFLQEKLMSQSWTRVESFELIDKDPPAPTPNILFVAYLFHNSLPRIFFRNYATEEGIVFCHKLKFPEPRVLVIRTITVKTVLDGLNPWTLGWLSGDAPQRTSSCSNMVTSRRKKVSQDKTRQDELKHCCQTILIFLSWKWRWLRTEQSINCYLLRKHS